MDINPIDVGSNVLFAPVTGFQSPAAVVAGALATNSFLNWWKGTPGTPTAPPAPAAPQTPDQMTTWTPEDQANAYQAPYNAWKTTAIPDVQPGAESSLPSIPDPTKILYDIAIGVAVLVAGTLLLKSMGHR